MDTKTYIVDNYIGKNKKEVKSQYFKFEFVGEGDKVIDQLPKMGEKKEEGSTIVIMLG
jgi:stage V sporulation protein D (sporulation-specific penicillin-binding protein)